MSEEEYSYGMLMPFITVKSVGGQHDDESYVAGWEMGALDIQLSMLNAANATFQIHTENGKQADLIAMKHGFTSTITPYDECPEWSYIVVTKDGTTIVEEDK